MKHKVYHKIVVSQCFLSIFTCLGSVEHLSFGLEKIAQAAPDQDLTLSFSDEGRDLPSTSVEKTDIVTKLASATKQSKEALEELVRVFENDQPRKSNSDVPAPSPKKEVSLQGKQTNTIDKAALLQQWNKQMSLLWNPTQQKKILENDFDSAAIAQLHTTIDELGTYIKNKKAITISRSYTKLFNDYIKALHATLEAAVLAPLLIKSQSAALQSEVGLTWLNNFYDSLKKQNDKLQGLITQLEKQKLMDYKSTKELKELSVVFVKPLRALYNRVLKEVENLRLKTRFEFDRKV